MSSQTTNCKYSKSEIITNLGHQFQYAVFDDDGDKENIYADYYDLFHYKNTDCFHSNKAQQELENLILSTSVILTDVDIDGDFGLFCSSDYNNVPKFSIVHYLKNG